MTTNVNIVVPVLRKEEGINYYRKTLTGSTSGILRGMPMDIPGGLTATNFTCGTDKGYILNETIDNNVCYTNCKVKSGVQDNMKDSNNNVIKYHDTKSYLRAKCMTYEQKNKKHDTKCSTDCNKIIINKKSNDQFKTQGAVSSGARLQKLKVNTIQNNNTQYRGNLQRNFINNNTNSCYRWRRMGSKIYCN